MATSRGSRAPVLLLVVLLLPFIFFLAWAGGQEGSGRAGGGKVSGTSEKPASVSAKYFYKFPPLVEQAREDSIVGVEITVLRVRKDALVPQVEIATGFVVGEDGKIITSSHVLGDTPSIWTNPDIPKRVHDGRNFFDVELLAIDWTFDLALLKVKDMNKEGVRFSKKPVKLATPEEKQNASSRLYTFRFAATTQGFCYFPLELGGYLMETNWINNELRVVSFGVVQGTVEEGFSGAPLIGLDGKVYGVITLKTDAYVLAATLEQVISFLKESLRGVNSKK